jgi:hypothetical protein
MAEQIFTARGAWLNGFYTLAVDLAQRSDANSLKALNYVRTHPLIDGWYWDGDREPAAQPRVGELSEIPDRHVRGLLTLPSGHKVACGCFIYHFEDEEDWLELYVPLGSVDRIHSTGAYPLVETEKDFEWQRELDTALVAVALSLYEHIKFPDALVGFEPGYDAMQEARMHALLGTPPEERVTGILWKGPEGLEWYPPRT